MMDDIVNQAMAKWPDVPHCYGWLALDARGEWRMRDERAQKLGQPGERIVHAALLGFINRNYWHDDRGCWHFQNGPQRVYVNLEATPYIARIGPMDGFFLHTGDAVPIVDKAWMTETGQLVLDCSGKIAMVDDRDMARYIKDFRIDGKQATDEQLLAWLNQPENDIDLRFRYAGKLVPVGFIARDTIAGHFGFIRIPQPG